MKSRFLKCALYKREIDSANVRMIEMNTNLRELYQDMRERRTLPADALKPSMRVGVVYPDSIHLIKIAATGPGRLENYNIGQQPVAVASISPSQPALKWEPDGTVHLLKLQEVKDCLGWKIFIGGREFNMLDYPGCSEEEILSHRLGILWRYGRAVWEPVGSLPSVPVTKGEERAVWQQTPLEKLVDDNYLGRAVNDMNKWFYERLGQV
ncbi:hypothetical protein HYU16_02325 [Candidatus Woesearchaeota archaeon]|nr:hypothetical protein [Candidatus Woesearchaeota archaeon]